jgi:hypothetical protein
VRIEWPQSKKELKRKTRKPKRRRVKIKPPKPVIVQPWQREMNMRAIESLDRAESEERQRRLRAFPEPPIVYPALPKREGL